MIPSHWAALMTVIVFCGFIKGLAGFGNSLLAIPLLSLFLPIKMIPPLMILLATIMDGTLTARMHKHTPWDKIIPILLAAIPGIITGTYVLKKINASFIQICVGSLLILYATYFLFFKSPSRRHIAPHRWEHLIGFLSGFFSGAIGAAGPPVIIYAALQAWKKDTIKAFFVSYFVITDLMTIASFFFSGFITSQVWLNFFWGLPSLALGIWLGHRCYRKTNETFYKKIISIVLLFLGLFMLYRSLS